MDSSTLFHRQRQLTRGDRQLRALEKEQLRTVREIKGTLENAKRRLERRRDWLRELEEVLQEEEAVLKELRREFIDLVDEAVYHVTQTRGRIEDSILATERELEETEVQSETVSEPQQEIPDEEHQDVKIYVHSLEGADHTPVVPEPQARIQWYYPGQNQL